MRAAQQAWERSAPPAALRDWIPEEGLVFRSGRETTKAAGCDGGASECAWPAGEAAQHFDGKHYLEGDGKIADFDYMQPFTMAAWIQPESANGAILSHVDDYFEGMGHGVLLVDGRDPRAHPAALDGPGNPGGERGAGGAASAAARGGDVRRRAQGGGRAHLCQRRAGGSEGAVRPEHGADPSSEDAAADRRGGRFAIYRNDRRREYLEARAGTGGGSRRGGRADSRSARPISWSARRRREIRRARDELAALQRERKEFFAQIPSVMVMADSATPRDTFLLKRGAYDAPGRQSHGGVAGGARGAAAGVGEGPAGPGTLAGGPQESADRARDGQSLLADRYFGFGIVKTVDDFGSQGESPVHPDLLDWLATEFMESGWNVKALQKTIVMSAPRTGSRREVTPELLQKDPDNRLLARGPRFRLGPEVIRDQALAVSGLLVEKVGGPSVKPYQPPGLWQELGGGTGYKQDNGDGLYRRSLYTYWKRTVAPPFMMNFDSPNREQCIGVREPHQFAAAGVGPDERRHVSGGRAQTRGADDEGGRCVAGRSRRATRYRLVLARAPDAPRRQVLLKALDGFAAGFRGRSRTRRASSSSRANRRATGARRAGTGGVYEPWPA